MINFDYMSLSSYAKYRFNLLFFIFCGHDFNIIQTDSRLRFIFIDEFVILKQVKSFKSLLINL